MKNLIQHGKQNARGALPVIFQVRTFAILTGGLLILAIVLSFIIDILSDAGLGINLRMNLLTEWIGMMITVVFIERHQLLGDHKEDKGTTNILQEIHKLPKRIQKEAESSRTETPTTPPKRRRKIKRTVYIR